MLRQHSQSSCLLEPMGTSHEARLEQHHYYWPDDDVWRYKTQGGTYHSIGKYFEDKIWTLPGEARGAKMLLFYFLHQPLRRYLHAVDGLKVIWLSRNPLASIASEWYAQQTSNWNARNPGEITPRKPTTVPLDFYLKHMRSTKDNMVHAKAGLEHHDAHHVSYHELRTGLEPAVHRICDFLEIQRELPDSMYIRLAKRPFKQLVTNWQEIKRHTPDNWQHYWDEPLT
jgi:hypothetical protein